MLLFAAYKQILNRSMLECLPTVQHSLEVNAFPQSDFAILDGLGAYFG